MSGLFGGDSNNTRSASVLTRLAECGNDNSVDVPPLALPDGWQIRDLFGGAIICALPVSFEDVSLLRQVPDHQEVFVDKDTELSLIVELLSYDENVSDEKAAAHYFEDLSQCNEAQESRVESTDVIAMSDTFMPNILPKYPKCALVGKQVVAKFNSNK